MNEIMIANKTGIAVIDKFITNIAQIAKDSNSNTFKTAFLFYSASLENSAISIAIKGMKKADGTTYKNFVEWAIDAYGMKKSNVYDYVKMGKRVLYDEASNTYFYSAHRDSLAIRKFSPETGACIEVTYPGFSFDIPTFLPSACAILATLDKKIGDVDDGYNGILIPAIKDGTLRVDMSVRQIKEVCKALSKGTKLDNSGQPETEETAEETKETAEETAEDKAEKMSYITKAMKWAVKNTETFFENLSSADMKMLHAIFEKTGKKIESAKESGEK